MRTLLVPLLPIVLTLAGCGTFTERLTRHVEEANYIAAACSTLPITKLAQRTQYEAAISNIVAGHLGFTATLGELQDLGSEEIEKLKAANKAVIPILMASLQRSMADLYPYITPAGRTRLDRIQEDANGLRQRVETIARDVDAAVKATIRTYQLVTLDADGAINAILVLQKYEKFLGTIALKMRSDLAAVVTTLGRLKLDVEQLRGDIVATRPGAPEAVKILDDHLKLALSTVTVLWDRLDDVLETGRFELEQLLDEKAAKEIGELVRTFTAYEAGRLAIRALHRASRALEHKLDQIDDKTWFIITLAQLAFHSDISRSIADAVRDAAGRPGDTAGPFGARELLTALAVASCERVLDDANTHALDVARADTLLAPLYSALICSYLEYENARANALKASVGTEIAAVQDATKTCIGKQPSDLKNATVSVRKDVLEKAGKADRELSSTVSRVQSSYSTQVLAPVVSKTETSRTPLQRQERKELLDGMRIMQKQVIPPG